METPRPPTIHHPKIWGSRDTSNSRIDVCELMNSRRFYYIMLQSDFKFMLDLYLNRLAYIYKATSIE